MGGVGYRSVSECMSRNRPNILAVGSFVMDQIMTTHTFPKPGQTVFSESFHKVPGGKGANQAVQMARLGANVTMVGKLGMDSNGDEIYNVCVNAGVNMEKVIRDRAMPTGCASIIILEENETRQNRILVCQGANMGLTEEDVSFLQSGIAHYDLVVLQLEIPMKINMLLAEWAHKAGVPVILNPAPATLLPDSLLKEVAFLTPNETEMEILTGISIQSSKAGTPDMKYLRDAADQLINKGVQRVIITLGSTGAVLFDKELSLFAPSESAVVADPTAAGDSFIGAFSVAWCKSNNLEKSLRYANQVAAITVSRMGAIPSLPTQNEVKLRYHVKVIM